MHEGRLPHRGFIVREMLLVGLNDMSNDLPVRRLPIRLKGDDRRVILRPFVMSNGRVRTLFDRLDAMAEGETGRLLTEVKASFCRSAPGSTATFTEHFGSALELTGWKGIGPNRRSIWPARTLTMEYAVDSAALFNPSIVPHPDQSRLWPRLRAFPDELRATGEGHVSSIVFRTGTYSTVSRSTSIRCPSSFSRSRVAPDRSYERALFTPKARRNRPSTATSSNGS